MAPQTNATVTTIIACGLAITSAYLAYRVHQLTSIPPEIPTKTETFPNDQVSTTAAQDTQASASSSLAVLGTTPTPPDAPSPPVDRSLLSASTYTITYTTTTGTCSSLAQSLKKTLLEIYTASSLNRNKSCVSVIDSKTVDWWDQILNIATPSTHKHTTPILIILIPTWSDGGAAPGDHLISALEEIASDWRVDPNHLKHKLKFAIFGVGSSGYESTTFCKPAKDLHKLLKKMGATPVNGLGMGDVEEGDIQATFDAWVSVMAENIRWNLEKNFTSLRRLKSNPKPAEHFSQVDKKVAEKNAEKNAEEKKEETGCCGGKKKEEGRLAGRESTGASCSTNADEEEPSPCGCGSEEESEPSDVENSDSDGEVGWGDSDYDEENGTDGYEDSATLAARTATAKATAKPAAGVDDLEDMGASMAAAAAEKADEQLFDLPAGTSKEMVTPKQAKALKKEGYKLIGSHSAVKLCRWTKHQLRGRGGCYKHTFYGITSYQCMEATPSLACANKCVFCWRHHKNPVGRTWRWKTDDPEYIVSEAVKLHVNMIKGTKGVPGVMEHRWQEAHTVRHCALSLVGEPIMYPRINELLQGLHDRNISTYLVTNGQHPDAIDDLIPVTQLYVSVDAPTPASLEAIDRPLFKDAWDRLRKSLMLVRKKRQRTVARLTIVKGWNSDEIDGYADLIALGQVSFVEIKGVTFCGTSDASNLNMSNSPWHHEVVEFADKLRKRLQVLTERGGGDPPPLYGLACEHKHSCCVLLARKDQFAYEKEDGSTGWKTWIDYDKFQQHADEFKKSGKVFQIEDYVDETPYWGLSGAAEEGFDPTDLRHRKKGKAPLYTKYDTEGIPTHGWDGVLLSPAKRKELEEEMSSKIVIFEREKKEMQESVDTLGGILKDGENERKGERVIDDPRLMYRGLTVGK